MRSRDYNTKMNTALEQAIRLAIFVHDTLLARTSFNPQIRRNLVRALNLLMTPPQD